MRRDIFQFVSDDNVFFFYDYYSTVFLFYSILRLNLKKNCNSFKNINMDKYLNGI